MDYLPILILLALIALVIDILILLALITLVIDLFFGTHRKR